MARKHINPRTKTPTTSRRSLRHIKAMDLAQETRGLVQFLDDLLTQGRDSITLEFNSLDGISSVLGMIDANLLSIQRGIDPDLDPVNSAALVA